MNVDPIHEYHLRCGYAWGGPGTKPLAGKAEGEVEKKKNENGSR